MFLTRLGYGSKAVVTGDITQVDLPTAGARGSSRCSGCCAASRACRSASSRGGRRASPPRPGGRPRLRGVRRRAAGAGRGGEGRARCGPSGRASLRAATRTRPGRARRIRARSGNTQVPQAVRGFPGSPLRSGGLGDRLPRRAQERRPRLPTSRGLLARLASGDWAGKLLRVALVAATSVAAAVLARPGLPRAARPRRPGNAGRRHDQGGPRLRHRRRGRHGAAPFRGGAGRASGVRARRRAAEDATARSARPSS